MSLVAFQKKVANYLRRRIQDFTPAGIAPLAPTLLFEVYALFRHPLGVVSARKYRHSTRLRLHLGCGANIKRGWLNMDLSPSADLQVDLRRRFPLPDNCSTIIYTEHFLEHLDYREPATSFVKECFRVLQPGGILSIAVPDGEMMFRMYVLGVTPEYLAEQKKWQPDWMTTQMERINFNFRQDFEHRFMYDFETLKKLLDSCGFVDVVKRDPDPSLDLPLHVLGSLYVQGRKPVSVSSDLSPANRVTQTDPAELYHAPGFVA